MGSALDCIGVHCTADMNSDTALRILIIFLVVSPGLSAPQIKSVEDRFFCKLMAPQTCANSCAGQDCTKHCVVVCVRPWQPPHVWQQPRLLLQPPLLLQPRLHL